MKKALSFVLTLAMVLSIVPMFGGIAFAVDLSDSEKLNEAINSNNLVFNNGVCEDSYGNSLCIIEQSGVRHIILKRDFIFSESENLVIATTTDIVLRLEGHSIKRNLTTPTDAGFVIKVASGSDLTILGESNSNKITGGNNNSSGGGIYVEGNGTLTIIGPVDISGNKAKNGGGIYAEKDSHINLREANITFSNDSAEKGGALYLETYAHIKGTIINDSVATYGGAVYVANNGWCEIENVTISTCSAIGDGARGGAVYVERGGTATFIVGTKVENCTATDLGGAIYAEGAVGLEKCTISNNSVLDAGAGAGIYLCSQGSLFLGSTAYVKDNKKSGTQNNVLVCSGASLFFGSGIDVTAPAIGMEIGITLESVSGNSIPSFTIISSKEEYKDYLTFENIDISKYEFKYENNELKLCEKQDPPAPSYDGGGVSYYTVKSNDSVNGSFKVDRSSMYSGGTVTITVTPDKGYTLETLTVLDKNGKEIEVKDLGNNKYSFKMPSGKVDVSATFMLDNTILNYCVDVKADDFYYDAVLWAYENKITDGTDEVHFSPLKTVTRAEVITFLWRAAGSPVVNYWMNMSDVKSDSYYTEAVRWALSEKITDGTGDNKFSPDKTCSRAEIVTLLARYAGVKDTAAGYTHNFTDVGANEYYSNAVAWAYENKITDGTGENKFSPFEDCQRGQVVTFLYRNFVK